MPSANGQAFAGDTIYDRGDTDGQLWIAMEIVGGTDGWRLLQEQRPIPSGLAQRRRSLPRHRESAPPFGRRR